MISGWSGLQIVPFGERYLCQHSNSEHMHLRMRFLFPEIRKTKEDAVGLVRAHFPFERFNHTGGLAFHQGVKCLIFLLVSFFFSHNECKSKNVNAARPHRTLALLPPPPASPALTSRPPGDSAPLLREVRSRRRASGWGWGEGGAAGLRRATPRDTLPCTAVTSAPAPQPPGSPDPGPRLRALPAGVRCSAEPRISMHPGKGD